MCKYTPPCKYTPAQTRCIFAFAYVYFIHICIFGHVNAQQIYTRMQIEVFLLFWVKLAVRVKYFCVKSKKYFNHSHFKTNTALTIHAHNIFTKILIFIYNNAQIHPNVTVQHLKSIPFVQKAWKTCVHTSVSDKNQSSSQTKGFMHGLVQKILGTCERVANKFLHPGANYTYMYNLHTVCKSAHVNGA